MQGGNILEKWEMRLNVWVYMMARGGGKRGKEGRNADDEDIISDSLLSVFKLTNWLYGKRLKGKWKNVDFLKSFSC